MTPPPPPPHTEVWMLWVSRPWMTASEFLWNNYETPTPRYSSTWWWNMSERHSLRGCHLVKICILSGAPRTVFSWWFSLRLLPFELCLSWANVRECLGFSGHFHQWWVELQCMFFFTGLPGLSLAWTANVTGHWLLMNHTNSTLLSTREAY